jgi:SPP1 family predicted phage head-tail adaptor
MFYMSAGNLRHNIVIQYDASDGTSLPDLKILFSLRAAKRGLRSRLYYEAAATQSENDVIFTIRYRSGITPAMQIVDGENIYKISADPVDPTDQRRWLEIHARRVSQNGR